jgi:hypothetical protein
MKIPRYCTEAGMLNQRSISQDMAATDFPLPGYPASGSALTVRGAPIGMGIPDEENHVGLPRHDGLIKEYVPPRLAFIGQFLHLPPDLLLLLFAEDDLTLGDGQLAHVRGCQGCLHHGLTATTALSRRF